MSRYYDQVAGVFLSADKVQGNMQGMNPYDYVGGNPETKNDPTGQRFAPPPQGPPMTTQDAVNLCMALTGCANKVNEFKKNEIIQTAVDVLSWGITIAELVPALVEAVDVNPELLQADTQQMEELSSQSVDEQVIASDALACSFTATTKVETLHGKQAIGKVHAGEKVLAYNPRTHKMEWQPIVHVWIHKDNDLVDMTITTPAQTPGRTNRNSSPQTQEVVHTNKKHPFFTLEKGFLPVGQIKVGMHLLRADGRFGIVMAWVLVPGVQTMYNLEVAQDHTFTVGSGAWVVHNCTPSFRSGFTKGIVDLLDSSNKGDRQEAEVGWVMEQEIGLNLTKFRIKATRSDGTLAGDWDAATKNLIVESKTVEELSTRDKEQLDKLVGLSPDSQYMNPGGMSKVLYFAPRLRQQDVQLIESKGGMVAQNWDDFIALADLYG